MTKNRTPFKTFNIILLFGFLVSVSAVVLSSLLIVSQNNYIKKAIVEEKGKTTLHLFEKEIVAFFYSLDSTLDSLGRLGELERNNSSDSSQLRKNLEFKQMNFMNRITKLLAYLAKDRIGINKMDTWLLIPNNFDTKDISFDFSKSEWYNNTMQSSNGEVVITGPFKDKFTSNLIYSITKKIYDDYGNFNGISLIDIDFKNKNSLFTHVANPLKTDLIVAKANGDIIFSNSDVLQNWNVFTKYNYLFKSKLFEINSGSVLWFKNSTNGEYFGIKYSRDFNLYFIATGSYNAGIYSPSIKDIKDRSYSLLMILLLVLSTWGLILLNLSRNYKKDYISLFKTISDKNFLSSPSAFDMDSIRSSEIKLVKDIIFKFKLNFFSYKKELVKYYDELYSKVIFFRKYIDDLITRFIGLRDFLQNKKINFSKLIENNAVSLSESKLASQYLFKIDELMGTYNTDFDNLSITLDLFKDSVKNIDINLNDKVNSLFDILSMIKEKNTRIDNDFNDVKDHIHSIENYYNIIENIIAKIRLLVINASIEVGRDATSSKNDSFILMLDEIKEHTDTVGEYMLFTKRDFRSMATNLVNINQSFNDKHTLIKDLDDSIKTLSYATRNNINKIEQHINLGYDIVGAYSNIDNSVKAIDSYHKKVVTYSDRFSGSFDSIMKTIIAYDEKNQQFINTFDSVFIEFKTFRDTLNQYVGKIGEQNKLE